jgi:hypothetical protein
MDIKNLSIVRQSYANVVFNHKKQEIASEIQGKFVWWIKISNIILVFLVLIFIVFQLSFPESTIFSSLGLGISIAEIIFLIIQLTFNFEHKEILHKNSALKFMGLRDSYSLLIADIMNGLDLEPIKQRRDDLKNQYQTICDLAPQTGDKEYKKTQNRLGTNCVENEEFTWSDEEIDRFLPEELRIKK